MYVHIRRSDFENVVFRLRLLAISICNKLGEGSDECLAITTIIEELQSLAKSTNHEH